MLYIIFDNFTILYLHFFLIFSPTKNSSLSLELLILLQKHINYTYLIVFYY